MTNQEKKQYLQQYRDLNGCINAEMEELARLRSMASKVTPTISDMPGAGSPSGDRLARAVERII